MWSQVTDVTDRETDGQTDRRTTWCIRCGVSSDRNDNIPEMVLDRHIVTGHCHLGFLNLLYFIGWWCPGDQDASPIQISSKLVDALWRYNDFMIFQYDYNWPFSPQNYGPHFTHTSALSVRKFWSAFYPLTVRKSARLQVRILHVANCTDCWQQRLPIYVRLVLVKQSGRLGSRWA